MSADVTEGMDRAVAEHDATAEIELINLIENNSPYPEVRAAVRNWDEDMPSNTLRAWVIGMLMVTLGSAMNMLFSLRNLNRDYRFCGRASSLPSGLSLGPRYAQVSVCWPI